MSKEKKNDNSKHLKPIKPRGLVRTCYIKKYDGLTYDLMCVEIEKKEVLREYPIGNPDLFRIIEERSLHFILDNLKEAELYDRQREGIKIEIDRETKWEADPKKVY